MKIITREDPIQVKAGQTKGGDIIRWEGNWYLIVGNVGSYLDGTKVWTLCISGSCYLTYFRPETEVYVYDSELKVTSRKEEVK